MVDFTKDWAITATLGEGAYGEVKLLTNKHTGENVAMKVVNGRTRPEVKLEVKKEVSVHRMLHHHTVIRFYGTRAEGHKEYIFLEYAPHGALFDRIEPEVGMPLTEARKYMSQLMDGVKYLHSMGIVHRDIKPENLLLDARDNLKISDFGLATMFRKNGKERLLNTKCGTMPYVAPEVIGTDYRAEPIDIWSCGIVLAAMISGELPWDKAVDTCKEFVVWRDGVYTNQTPWDRCETLVLSLLRKMLAVNPQERATLKEVISHKWFKRDLKKDEKKNSAKRMRKETVRSRDEEDEVDISMVSSSQVMRRNTDDICDEVMKAFLSQPTSVEDMLVSSQMLNTQPTSAQTIMQKMVKRMTRFTVNLPIKEASDELEATLNSLELEWKAQHPFGFTISCMDRRKTLLVFKANLMSIEQGTFCDFRLSRGCGLEFKKIFVDIRTAFKHLIVRVPDF